MKVTSHGMVPLEGGIGVGPDAEKVDFTETVASLQRRSGCQAATRCNYADVKGAGRPKSGTRGVLSMKSHVGYSRNCLQVNDLSELGSVNMLQSHFTSDFFAPLAVQMGGQRERWIGFVGFGFGHGFVPVSSWSCVHS